MIWVDGDAWHDDLNGHREFFSTVDGHLPQQLILERELLSPHIAATHRRRDSKIYDLTAREQVRTLQDLDDRGGNTSFSSSATSM
jgi:hypothetical protein